MKKSPQKPVNGEKETEILSWESDSSQDNDDSIQSGGDGAGTDGGYCRRDTEQFVDFFNRQLT